MLEFRFEFLLGGSWVDVTSYVRQKNTVTIKRGKSDESVKLTPSTAKFTLDNSDDRFNPRNPMGPYFGLLVRNTPVRIFAVVNGADRPRFYGEVYGFEPRWNEDRSDCYVSIEAAGVLRRILQNQTEPKSAYRSWVNNHSGNPVPAYYWPLEDGSDAVEGLPDIGASPAIFNQTPEAGKTWGAGEMNDWFPNGVQIPNLYGITFPCDMRGSSASAWEMTALVNFESDESVVAFEIDCGYHTWWVVAYATTNQLLVIRPDGSVGISSFSPGILKDIGPVWITFRLSFALPTHTAYVTWERIGRESDAINVSVAGTAPGAVLSKPRFMTVHNSSNADAVVNVSNVSFSECATGSTGIGTSYTQMKGSPGEEARTRFDRLSADQGVTTDRLYTSWIGTLFVPLGRQYVQSYEDHLEEIISSTSGIVVEDTASADLLIGGGLAQGSWVADLFYDELVGSIEPTEDDQIATNQVTVSNRGTGTAVIRKQSGEMSIDQIGRFESKLDTNTYRNTSALNVAYLKLAKGTQGLPRFPSVTVSAASAPTPLQHQRYLEIGIGRIVILKSLTPAGYYDDLPCQVVGIEESFNQTDHRITFNLVPNRITYSRFMIRHTSPHPSDPRTPFGMDDCTTSALVNSTTTTIDVETVTSRWTTTSGDWPFDILIAGERITVTAVSNIDSNTQRFTVTRSVNGVVKSLPAGSKVELFPGGYLGAF